MNAVVESKRPKLAIPTGRGDWTVSGRVTYAESGLPAVDVRIRAMDADFLFDDFLGEANTDTAGKFSIVYDVRRFRDLFERAPDVYLMVFDRRGELLTDTRDAVVRNAGAELEIHVQLPGFGPDVERPKVRVAGMPVDRETYERLTSDDLLSMAELAFQGRDLPEAATLLARLSPELTPETMRKRLCFTPLARFLRHTVELKRWDRAVALRLEEVLIGYTPTAGYASYTTPNFTLNYETSGSDQPPTSDSGGNVTMPGTGTVVGTTIGGNGVPDYVERLGFWLENALATYVNPPFSLRNPAASGRIPVSVTGTAPGFAGGGSVTIGRNLNDDLLAAVPTHELMHLIQDLYETAGAAGDWNPGVREGGAVLAEDVVFDTHNRYLVEASLGGGTLQNPHRSLKDAGQRYELALFLKYLSEQQSGRVTAADEPAIGVETYRQLLERFDAAGYTDPAFAQAVAALPWYQGFHRCSYLDAAKLDETNSETLLGNFWLACVMKDFGLNVPDRRFDFMEDEETATWDSIFMGGDVVGTLGSLTPTSSTTLTAGATITLSSGAGGSVNPFAARVYKVDVGAAVDMVKLEFTAGAGFTEPLVQMLLVEPGNTVRDILRSDQRSWSRTVANLHGATALDHIMVVVAGTGTGGTFTLTVRDVAAAPDVTVTRWHHQLGRHYEIDAFAWAWTWVSPDVWVDNDGNGLADSEVFFNQNNKLFVRLHNQGLADAAGIGVELWYQDASGGLSPTAWLPVQNTGGVTQSLTGKSLAAGASNQWSVDWAPVPSGTSQHFCIRAVVSVPGDPNADNKRCLSNFGNVKAAGPYVDLPLLARMPVHGRELRTFVVPRTQGRWVVSAFDLAQSERRLDADATRVADFRLRRHATLERHAGPERLSFERIANVCRAPVALAARREAVPDPCGHYPTDPRALPPGLEDVPMVTITQVVDGRVTGGFTWALREEA
jgi:hypothetical protein